MFCLYWFYSDTSGVREGVWWKTAAEGSGCKQVSWLCLWWYMGNCQSFNESHGDCDVQREIQHPSQLYCHWPRSGTNDSGGHGEDQLLWCDSVYKVSKFCLSVCLSTSDIWISRYFKYFKNILKSYIFMLNMGQWQIKMSDDTCVSFSMKVLIIF